MAELEITTREALSSPQVMLLALTGGVDDKSYPLLQERVQQVVKRGCSNLILDLSGVRFFNEADKLLGYDRALRKRGGGLVLYNVPAKLRVKLQALELDAKLALCTTLDDAVKRLAPHAQAAQQAAPSDDAAAPTAKPSRASKAQASPTPPLTEPALEDQPPRASSSKSQQGTTSQPEARPAGATRKGATTRKHKLATAAPDHDGATASPTKVRTEAAPHQPAGQAPGATRKGATTRQHKPASAAPAEDRAAASSTPARSTTAPSSNSARRTTTRRKRLADAPAGHEESQQPPSSPTKRGRKGDEHSKLAPQKSGRMFVLLAEVGGAVALAAAAYAYWGAR